MWISASFCLLAGVLAIVLSTILFLENKKMEREGIIPKKGEEGRPVYQHDIATGEAKIPKFRYIW